MLAKRLKYARKQKHITQQELAEILNISARSYQRYEAENGFCEPPLGTLIQIADILDVSLDYLTERDEWLKSHGVYVDE